MAREIEIQQKLIRYLKSKGCWVIKLKPGLGIPVGSPDILALYEGWWGAFEVKATEKSKFQPLQKETLKKLDQWSYATAVYAENYEKVIAELEHML